MTCTISTYAWPHVIVVPRCGIASACCICGSSSVAYVLPMHGCDSGEHAQTTSHGATNMSQLNGRGNDLKPSVSFLTTTEL